MQEQKDRNIVLIGFMGTGKSTVGQALAERLHWTFVDSDAEVERREGRLIRELFADDGEAYFREREHEAIAALLAGTRQVISTGGGAVLAERNRKLMLEGGTVVALTASMDTILLRVSADSNRPLLQGDPRERVRTLMEDRQGAYGFADWTIDTDGKRVEDIVSELLEKVRGHEKPPLL